MKIKIKLSDFYPPIPAYLLDLPEDIEELKNWKNPMDEEVEVTEEELAEIKAAKNFDDALRRANRRNSVRSLDAEDGIQEEASEIADSINSTDPETILEMARRYGHLHCALHSLPEAQRRRMVEHYLNGVKQTDIAEAEEVTASAVSESIIKGKKSLMEKFTAFENGNVPCEIVITIRDAFDWKQFQ